VRIPRNPTSPSPTHMEIKTVDGAANPYLALGAIIAAGLDGIQKQLTPPPPVNLDPATLAETERSERQIERLPQSLAESIAALSQDQVLRDALGADLSKTFLAVRQAEWEAMKDLNLEEEVRLLLERY
jgi:glutamine synthetase